jgi:putative ABC transport system permease protein
MKYLPLIWAALARRKPRTIFTMLSIVVAFLLYGLLSAVQQAFSAGVEVSGADRLVTTGRYSLTQILPYGHRAVIESIPGVERVTFASWFGGVYQTERNFFAQFPVDPESYLEIYPEIQLPEDQKQAFLRTRTGAVIAKALADRFGWKVGDRIPIQATIWPSRTGGNTWEFDLVGIFDADDPATRGQHEYMLFQHEYFDEARQFGAGYVGWFITRVQDASNIVEVARAIDAAFANSPSETRTETEKAFNQSFIKQLGDIGLIITSILGAVFFTLLFLTGNTMMQSVRERIPELAVLKTLGYSDRLVLVLVLAEALALCVLAAAAGLATAVLLVPGIAQSLPSGFSSMELTALAAAEGIGLSVLLALVVGLPPAWRAMRLDIVNALSEH